MKFWHARTQKPWERVLKMKAQSKKTRLHSIYSKWEQGNLFRKEIDYTFNSRAGRLGLRGLGKWWLKLIGFFLRWWKCSKINCGIAYLWNTLKNDFILHAFGGCIMWCISTNCFSLFFFRGESGGEWEGIADGQNHRQIHGDTWMCVGVGLWWEIAKTKLAGGRGQIRKVRSPQRGSSFWKVWE